MNTCDWLVHKHTHDGACEYDEQWGECGACAPFIEGPLVVECGAPVTELSHGWECEAGHSHYYNAEYFDHDEIAGMAARGISLPANARPI